MKPVFAAAVSLYSHVSISDSSVLTATPSPRSRDLTGGRPASRGKTLRRAGIVTTPCGVNPLICPHYVAYLFPVYANEMHV